MTESKYPRSMIYFHWIVAFLMIATIVLAATFWGVKYYGLPLSYETAFVAFIGHETAGFFLLIFALCRVLNGMLHRYDRPASVNSDGSFEYYLEKLAHVFLKYGVILLAVLGWLTGNAKGYELHLFGLQSLGMPNLVTLGNPAESASNSLYLTLIKYHGYMAYFMVVVVALHIGAVILHQIKGSPVITRMVR